MSTEIISEVEEREKDKRDAPLGGRFVGWASNYLDERTSLSGLIKELGRKIFPDHWSFMLGEIALWAFVVVLLSGTYLTFFFDASMVETHYYGAYPPMRGIEMSAAMASTMCAGWRCWRATTAWWWCTAMRPGATCRRCCVPCASSPARWPLPPAARSAARTG